MTGEAMRRQSGRAEWHRPNVRLWSAPPGTRLSSVGDAAPRPTPLVDVTGIGCQALAAAAPQALGLTYWFDAAPHGQPYTIVVKFTGRRIGLVGEPGLQDTFVASERIDGVIPGSGRHAITTRLFDLPPGQWNVTAAFVTEPHIASARPPPGLPPAQLVSTSGRTAFGPLIRARAPGARLGAWPALVGCGLVTALTVQARLAANAHLPVGATLSMSVMATVAGLLGARIYHVAERSPCLLLHPQSLLNAGLCIQGFVLAATATASIGMVLIGIPVGRFLDVTAPGLLFGMGVGRFGCFFGGCCAGRPTASRWGLWSSDRRWATRRVPTQLLEAALAFSVGFAALLAVVKGFVEPAGAAFVLATAVYTLGRQLLLPWRDLPRKSPNGRRLSAAVAAAVVLAGTLVAVLA